MEPITFIGLAAIAGIVAIGGKVYWNSVRIDRLHRKISIGRADLKTTERPVYETVEKTQTQGGSL